MNDDKTTVDSYVVPEDPFDSLMCDSCQRVEAPRRFGEAKSHRR